MSCSKTTGKERGPRRHHTTKMRHSLAGTTARPSNVAVAHHAKSKTVVVARAAPRGGSPSGPSSSGGSSPPSRVEVLKKEKELLQETLAAAAQATDQLAGALQVRRDGGGDGIERKRSATLLPGQSNQGTKEKGCFFFLPLQSEARARSIFVRFEFSGAELDRTVLLDGN